MERLDGTGKTKTSKGSTRFSSILKQKNSDVTESETVLPEQHAFSVPVEEAIENTTVSKQEPNKQSANPKSRKKVAKRGNPDYTQSLFWLLHKTSKQLDRELLNLSDAGKVLDRSEMIEELLSVFYSLSEKVGAEQAYEQLKELKTDKNLS